MEADLGGSTEMGGNVVPDLTDGWAVFLAPPVEPGQYQDRYGLDFGLSPFNLITSPVRRRERPLDLLAVMDRPESTLTLSL